MIEAALAKNDVFSVDDFARMQFDSYSMTAASYVPLLQHQAQPESRQQGFQRPAVEKADP